MSAESRVSELADPIVATDDAAQQQNGASGQEVAEIAQPQEDAEQPDQSPESEGEKLTEEQKTIRKLQRRVDRLTAGRGAATREAELLREQLAGLQQQPTEQQDEQRFDPKEIDRLATERARELTRQQAVAEKANAVIAAGKKFAGFDEAVNTVAEEVPFTDRKGNPTPFIEAVLDTDKPAAVLHWLGNNPDEAAAFRTLTPVQIGRRIALLKSRIEREAKNTSAAPTPLRPVSSRSSPDAGPSDKDDVKTWMEKEEARLAAKRKARFG
jgi:hypothetical protein